MYKDNAFVKPALLYGEDIFGFGASFSQTGFDKGPIQSNTFCIHRGAEKIDTIIQMQMARIQLTFLTHFLQFFNVPQTFSNILMKYTKRPIVLHTKYASHLRVI